MREKATSEGDAINGIDSGHQWHESLLLEPERVPQRQNICTMLDVLARRQWQVGERERHCATRSRCPFNWAPLCKAINVGHILTVKLQHRAGNASRTPKGDTVQ